MAISYPQVVTSMDLLSSTIRLDRLVSFLVDQNVRIVALTNSTLYGVLPFQQQLLKHGIQPVIGLRYHLQLENEQLQVVSYCQTDQGFKNLLKLSSAIETKHVEAVPLNWFKAYSAGLLSAIVVNEENYEAVKSIFSVKVVPAVTSDTMQHTEWIEQLKKQHDMILPFAPAQMEAEEDQLAFQVLTALKEGKKLQEVGEVHALPLFTGDRWNSEFSLLNNWDQLFYDAFPTHVQLVQSHPSLPRFQTPDHHTAESLLKSHSLDGLNKRFHHIPNGYMERLEHELHVITSMGFSDYFLIVQDFIQYAKRQGIAVGPGRGSSASSLVAYCLGITDVDPIQYGLLFERFLNPERITLPDIDVDFADYRRDEVIAYVREKYGAAHVAQILAYGTLSTKAVAREVARVMEFPQEVLAFLSRAIPNQVASLEVAVEKNTELQQFIKREEGHALWYELAKRLEGFPRNTTVHAAGVVISDAPLVEVVPIEEHQEGMYLTQWTMKEVEAAGLLKMDFLGLRNLSMIEQMVYHVRQKFSPEFSLNQIPLDDPKTLSVLAAGDTLGVFQFESSGMRQALQQVNPTSFRDVIAVNALFRPGPMAFIPTFAARKHGKEAVHYPHPSLEGILNETYGIIVYQEQIMQIAQVVGRYSYAEADLLRRAISKKDRLVLQQEQQKFVEKAKNNSFPSDTAAQIYDLIVRFAEYGFPKSHATAYSLIAYQMAYIKAQFPVAFYTSLLSSYTGNKDKQAWVYRELKRKGIQLLPPDLSKSKSSFMVEKEGIRIGLSSISGVPRQFLQKVYRVREQRMEVWKSLFELAADLSAQFFTRPNMEPLIKAGALDFLNRDRAVLLASLDPAVMHAELVRPKDTEDLFSNVTASFGEPKYTEANPMPLGHKLQFEKEVLGTYVSTHPVELVRKSSSEKYEVLDGLEAKRGQQIQVIGLLRDVHKIRTKKGQAMAFAKLEDERSDIDLTFFPEPFALLNVHLKENTIVSLRGKVELRHGQLQLIVQQLTPL